MSNTDARTLQAMRAWGLNPDSRQLELLNTYARYVLEKNRLLNLTSVSGLAEIWRRHIADGALFASAVKPLLPPGPALIADAGAGAGYIGITAKILFPEMQLALYESSERKCSFLNWVLSKLELNNAVVERARVGAGAASAQADCVVERAMGNIEDIIVPCLALAKTGGIFAAFQSGGEVPACAITKRPDCKKLVKYTLPCDGKERTLLLFTKL